MARRDWTVTLDGQTHIVALEHGTITGKRTIWADGLLVDQGQKIFDTGTVHRFRLGSHPATVIIRTDRWGARFFYDLCVDGRLLDGSQSEAELTSWVPESSITREQAAHMGRYLGIAVLLVIAGVATIALTRSSGGGIGLGGAIGFILLVTGLSVAVGPALGMEMPGRHWNMRCPLCGQTFSTNALRDPKMNPTLVCPHCTHEFRW